MNIKKRQKIILADLSEIWIISKKRFKELLSNINI